MVDEHELELSDDKLAYLCRCMTEDMTSITSKLRSPYFQQFICQLIEFWCDHYGEDVDFLHSEHPRSGHDTSFYEQQKWQSAIHAHVSNLTERKR